MEEKGCVAGLHLLHSFRHGYLCEWSVIVGNSFIGHVCVRINEILLLLHINLNVLCTQIGMEI